MKRLFLFLLVALSYGRCLSAGPLDSKAIVKSSPAANSCKSFYYGGLPVISYQDDLVKQIERSQLKRLADFRRVYYHFEKYASSLSVEMREALAAYKGVTYRDVNHFLRNGVPLNDNLDVAKLKNLTDLIDNAIDMGPSIPKNIVLFRGMSVKKTSKNAFAAAKAGDIVADKGFTSTSLSVRTAMNFGIGMMAEQGIGLLQVIHIKSDNRRGLYLEAQSGESESEILIDRNSRYRIIRTQRVIVENKIDALPFGLPQIVGSEPPLLGGSLVLQSPDLLIPKTEDIDGNQLNLFTPEELPIPWSHWPTVGGGFVEATQNPVTVIVQHIELLQDHNDR